MMGLLSWLKSNDDDDTEALPTPGIKSTYDDDMRARDATTKKDPDRNSIFDKGYKHGKQAAMAKRDRRAEIEDFKNNFREKMGAGLCRGLVHVVHLFSAKLDQLGQARAHTRMRPTRAHTHTRSHSLTH